MIKNANITRFMQRHGIKSYPALLDKSVQDIGWFWDQALRDLGIAWYEPYQKIYDDSKGLAWTKWFLGGKTNIVLNCIDRYQEFKELQNKIAFIWEGECGATKKITYQQLHAEVGALSLALKELGIKKGDAVCLYMPMIPEMVFAFFAILKIGAMVVPVFSGFGPQPLAVRLEHAEVKLVFTADGGLRRGKNIPIKEACDEALKSTPQVKHVIVVKRLFREDTPWQKGRDLDYETLVAKHRGQTCPTEKMAAEDPSLVIYTSGTTGKPKGCVHTHAGALAQVVKEVGYNFDTKPEDVFFWLSDIGWMMGPWEMIGTLALGATFVIYEGAPDWPKANRLWEMVERHQVTILGISPTAIRVLKKAGDEWVSPYAFKHLRILGSTGEAWDPESYEWFYKKVGHERCPIINISGGTEIIGCLLAPLPIAPIKGVSLQGPSLGMDVDVWSEEGKSLRGEVGYLVCKKPAPSMTKGFLKDPERYLETYFSQWPNIWNHGDWAYVDEEGFWFLRGRADDTIKVSGRRTGPAEIESAAMNHPAVAEAAAIGIPHDIKGEGVAVFVVLKSDFTPSLNLEKEIVQNITDVLGKTLRPEALHFIPMLPKTRSGKIVRGLIKKKYLGKELGDLSSVENPQALEQIPLMN